MSEDLTKRNLPCHLANLDTQEAWNTVQNTITGLIERHIPKKRYLSMKKPPWLNRDIKGLIKERRKAWDVFKKDKSDNSKRENYNKCRNLASRETIKAKSDYEEKIANDCKKNPKQFWKHINSKIKSRDKIVELEDKQGNITRNDHDKAELLNDYFSSVFTNEAVGEIPIIPLKHVNQLLTEIQITNEMILKQLKGINISKSPGPDGIHAKVLHELADEMAPILLIVYTLSQEEGCVPTQWKEANVTPLFKKGKRRNPGNYRPVSLTAICCKILEIFFRDAIMKHLEDNKIILNDQHGFRGGKSCNTQLLEVMELWTNFIEHDTPWDCIYLDFAKAFDSVPHNRLLSKIKSCGIEGKVWRWIKDFLFNRQQRVAIGEEKSSWKPVTSGIPQGSVLGPILFIIFINDLPDEIESYTKLFADDTKLFRTIESIEDVDTLQTDIDKLLAWSQKWQLPFNTSKCKIIHYGKKNANHAYTMNGNPITVVQDEKDLGVTFDNSLNFKIHVRNITAKANGRVGLIKRSFMHLNKSSFLTLYKAMVRPILEYCANIWFPINKFELDEIEKVQHRATKIIPGLHDLPYPARLRKLNLHTLRYRRNRNDIIQVFRILKGIDKLETNDFFEVNTDQRTRGHPLKLKKERCQNRIRQNCFSQRVINSWNALPREAVMSDTLNAFKTQLDKAWKNDRFKFDELGID